MLNLFPAFCLSNRSLKQFTLGAVATVSDRLFHRLTIFIPKKLFLIWLLYPRFFSFIPLLLVLGPVDDELRWLAKLNSSRPKLSSLVSVFGLSERLIQKVKWLMHWLNDVYRTAAWRGETRRQSGQYRDSMPGRRTKPGHRAACPHSGYDRLWWSYCAKVDICRRPRRGCTSTSTRCRRSAPALA